MHKCIRSKIAPEEETIWKKPRSQEWSGVYKLPRLRCQEWSCVNSLVYFVVGPTFRLRMTKQILVLQIYANMI